MRSREARFGSTAVINDSFQGLNKSSFLSTTRLQALGERAGAGGVERLPVPGQEFGNARRQVVSNAGEHVGEVVLRIETVELGAFDQRIDRGGAAAAGIGAGKQVTLAANSSRTPDP
jgi:hypothetical protein